MNYDKQKVKYASWWHKKHDRPSDCLLVGSKANVNLGWFVEKDGRYELTESGIKAYKRLLKNNHSINKNS